MYKVEKYNDYNKRTLLATSSEPLTLEQLSVFYDENYRWIEVSKEDESETDYQSFDTVLEVDMSYLKEFCR